MVATTFAADTPLAVTGMVAVGGIAGNWLWWCFVASGMLTVFFYARLWRRSGVMTDIEFSEIRYSGKPAAFLRGFRALYLGIPINCIILGWVNKAMVDILMLVLGVTKIAGAGDRDRHDRAHVVHLDAQRAVGRAGHRPVSVRHQDGHGDRAGGVRGARGGRDRRDEGEAARARCHAGQSGLGAELRSRSEFRVDAADHVLRLHFAELVGHLVSRRGAWRRRLHRAAHVQREGRKEFAARDAVVQHRALRDAAMAVDSGRAGVADSVSGPGEARDRLHPRDDRVSAAVAARPDDRGVRGRLHVDHRHAAQLGRELSGQRFLPPLSEAARDRPSLRGRVASRDGVS